MEWTLIQGLLKAVIHLNLSEMAHKKAILILVHFMVAGKTVIEGENKD